MIFLYHFWEAFYEELQHIMIDAYWQAEYEAVSRSLDQ